MSMLWDALSAVRDLGRVQEIAAVLIRYGFGDVVQRVGMARVLERAGLVERRKVGRQQICRLRAGRLKEASEWLGQWERFWSDRLDALEAALKEERE